MKSILLASASLFAFSGAAFADAHTSITFGGDATVGYNDLMELGALADEEGVDAIDGFYFDSSLSVTMSATLDNGVTASATYGITVADDATGIALESDSWLLSLSTDMATLRFGDVDPAAEDIWDGVDGSEVAGFNDADTHFDTAGFEAILRGDVMFAGVNAALSFGVDTGSTGNDLTGENIDALQAAATGTFGAFGFIAAYQQEFSVTPQIIAVAATASFFGADLKAAYEDDGTTSSIGASVSYPVGPITVGAYATQNTNDVDDTKDGIAYGVSGAYASGPISVEAAFDVDAAEVQSISADASYDTGIAGITVLAGVFIDDLDSDFTGFYAAAEADLGGGASLLLSYATDGDDDTTGEDLGGPEYQEGATVELAFEF